MFHGIRCAARLASRLFAPSALCLLAVFALCLVVVALGPLQVRAADTQEDQQKMVQEYMKMMAPNKNHAYFNDLVGKWDVKTTAWMAPGQEPVVSQSSCEASVILGGRFLMMKFAGTMFGQPFEGLEVVGYDNLKNKYVTFWIDNQSTGFYLTEGTRDTLTRVETETGDWPDPMTGKSIKVRSITKFVSKDEYVYELYTTPPGAKESKSLENRSTRKK
jgi:hypothetical protein